MNNIDPKTLIYQNYNSNIPFQYTENNAALYFTANRDITSKLNVTTGLRIERFTTNSKVEGYPSILDTNYTNLYPDIRFLYRLNPSIKFIASYSKKIQQPSYNQLDPNIAGGYDSLNQEKGNPILLPTFSHTLETELSFFDYANIGFSYSNSKYPYFLVFDVLPNSFIATGINKTFSSLKTYSVNMGIPIPFKFFTEGFSFLQKANSINIDELNYIYLNSSLLWSSVEGASAYTGRNNPFLFVNAYTQIILPKKITLTMYYNSGKGAYNIYYLNNYQKSLNIYFSKYFYKEALKVSLSVVDLFNTSNTSATLTAPNFKSNYLQKLDSRVFGINITYNLGKLGLLRKSNEIKDDETEKKRMEKQQGIKL